MNAQLKTLENERDYLTKLVFGLTDQSLPFTVAIGDLHLPESVKTKARWGMSNYVTMRLRELHDAIAQIKKEQNA